MFALIWSNFIRKKGRLFLTLFSITVAFVLFGILAATWHGFAHGIKSGSTTLIVLNRTSRFHGLPLAYRDKIKTVKGVRKVSYAEWFGGYYQDHKNQMQGLAVDASTFFDVVRYETVSAAQIAAWEKDRIGVLVSAQTMKKYGWKIGEQIPVLSTVWGNPLGGSAWHFTIDGIIHPIGVNQPSDNFLLHYQYLNRSTIPERQNGVSLFYIRIAAASQAAGISLEIDRLFTNSPDQTRTSTLAAETQGYTNQFANLGMIVLAVSGAVFFGLLLLTGNVYAQSVRERFSELATLKALGYPNRIIGGLVVGEALLLMIVGSIIGLAIAKGITPTINAAVDAFLPGFYLSIEGLVFGFLLALFMGILIVIIPAIQVTRLGVASTLRRA